MEEFIQNYLSDKLWRLNNLYYIIDKEDRVTLLKLNYAQQEVYRVKHPKTITLKSRQQGISTYKIAEGLDKCLFNSHSQAGVQSYGQSEAKKLYKKAMFMWDKLDPDIKELLDIRLVAANQEGMTFSNGSTLKIGNFRGDTLSFLHVSELAKIAKRFPEKAEELNSGAFEAVSTNSSISIESTAEGAAGLFYDIWQTAVRRLALVGGDDLTPLDFYPIFLSWVDDPDCSMEQYYESIPEDEEYFELVEKDLDIVLTQAQKNWAAGKRSRLGEKFDQEYPYNPASAFSVSVEGTYYRYQYERILREKRIKHTPYNSMYPVFAVFDLGMDDQMCINFTQVIEGAPKILAEYQNSGQKISYYVDIMRYMPFPIEMTYLPHDANVHDMSTGRTRLEEFQRLGVTCQLLPKLSIQEGINAARQYLDVVEIDPSCVDTIGAIQNYRQKWDKRLQVFMGVPEHDDHSHYADVVRYSSLALTYHVIEASITEDEETIYRRAVENHQEGVAL